MKSLFVSDLHASLTLPYAKANEDLVTSDRLEDVIGVLEHAGRVADEEGVERIFILGDLFHDRHPDAPTLVRVSRALRALATAPRRVWLLPGNHDAHDRAGKVYSLNMFEELKIDQILVATCPTTVVLGDLDFVLMPWLPEHLFAERIRAHRPTKTGATRVLLMHQSVPGAVEGAWVSEKGVSEDAFLGFSLILSGHIHTPQVFASGRGQYLGSPLHLRFTDADDITPRGFWLLDHAKLEGDPLLGVEALTFIPSEAPRFVRWRFFPDGDMTAHEMAEAILPELVEEARELAVPIYLEAIIEGDRFDVEATTKTVQASIEATKAEIRFSRISRVILDDGASERVRKAATTSGRLASPRELAAAYVRSCEKFPGEVNPDELLTFVSEVLS